jgi:hypothetical protein
MRYLLFTNILVLLMACNSPYKGLHQANASVDCIYNFKPAFQSVLYNTQVDVVGKHLSGLLLFKTMPDSSVRLVFSNQTGFKFFDFEFDRQDSFIVHYIIKQMDKPAVITTLRKDFELVLMHNLASKEHQSFRKNGSLYQRFSMETGYNYYITDSNCLNLLRAERASSRKTVTSAVLFDYKDGMPDSIGISHTKFSFTIGLKRIYKNASR